MLAQSELWPQPLNRSWGKVGEERWKGDGVGDEWAGRKIWRASFWFAVSKCNFFLNILTK